MNMSRIGTIDFSGHSGHVYTFNVYPFKHDFGKEKGAVYVITKRVVKHDGVVDHNLLFIGTINNIITLQKIHKKSACLTREGANCVCTYWEDNPATRVTINDDLINHYHPPCNYED
jgi:hypothetical protein